jgi:hypothetical protein
MKKFLALAGAAAVLAGAPLLTAQMAKQPTPEPLLPPGVIPIVRQRLHDPNAEVEQRQMPTPGGPPPARRPASPPSGRPSVSDGASVDAIVAALYASVSHATDGEPDWERMRAIFLPVGMLVPPKAPRDDIFTVLDVDGFQDRVRKGIAAQKQKGEQAGFFEREIARKTDCFGNVCQVFSTYESRRAVSDEKPFVRGINSIQLVRDGRRWWIASVVWDTERPDNPIPSEYLKKNRE